MTKKTTPPPVFLRKVKGSINELTNEHHPVYATEFNVSPITEDDEDLVVITFIKSATPVKALRTYRKIWNSILKESGCRLMRPTGIFKVSADIFPVAIGYHGQHIIQASESVFFVYFRGVLAGECSTLQAAYGIIEDMIKLELNANEMSHK